MYKGGSRKTNVNTDKNSHDSCYIDSNVGKNITIINYTYANGSDKVNAYTYSNVNIQYDIYVGDSTYKNENVYACVFNLG